MLTRRILPRRSYPLVGVSEIEVWSPAVDWQTGSNAGVRVQLPTGEAAPVIANNAGLIGKNRWMFADGVVNQYALIVTQDQLQGTMVTTQDVLNPGTVVRLDPELPVFVHVNDRRDPDIFRNHRLTNLDLVVRIRR
jgi:hypothetical protein